MNDPNQMLGALLNSNQAPAAAQQPPQPQYQQPPQPQYQQPPQAAPVGTPPQAPPQDSGGGFAAFQAAATGLYDEVGGTHGPRINFDCDAKYVAQIDRLVSGRSTKPTSLGRPYLAADLKIVRIDFLGVERDRTQIQEGTVVSYFTWIPRDPKYMTLEDKFNLAEVLDLGSAIMKLRKCDENKSPYLNPALIDQMCQDDGAMVKGRFIGIQVVGKPGKEGSKHANTTFYNPDFYAVDSNGQRIEGFTPAELQAGASA